MVSKTAIRKGRFSGTKLFPPRVHHFFFFFEFIIIIIIIIPFEFIYLFNLFIYFQASWFLPVQI
jgi:hypothetical protein